MDHIMLLKVPIEFDFHGLKRASLYPQPFSFNFHLKGKKVATVLRFEPRLMRGAHSIQSKGLNLPRIMQNHHDQCYFLFCGDNLTQTKSFPNPSKFFFSKPQQKSSFNFEHRCPDPFAKTGKKCIGTNF